MGQIRVNHVYPYKIPCNGITPATKLPQFTADFTCIEQLVYSVVWPYTCNSITESWHRINQLFNASEICCTVDFSSVRIFCDCMKRSVASSVALYTTETIQVDRLQLLRRTHLNSFCGTHSHRKGHGTFQAITEYSNGREIRCTL